MAVLAVAYRPGRGGADGSAAKCEPSGVTVGVLAYSYANRLKMGAALSRVGKSGHTVGERRLSVGLRSLLKAH